MSEPSFGELLLHMLWPVSCPVCGALGKVVCEPCLLSLLTPQLPRCLGCGGNFPCRLHPKKAKIRAGCLYEGAARQAVLRLKHGGYKALGARLGKRLAEIYDPPAVDLLLPVPLHEKSRRRYNQAELIALGMAEVWGIEVWNGARWAYDTTTRIGMGAAERASLSPSAFIVHKKLEGMRVCLVDDVCTTGSTLSRLAQTCEEMGVTVVEALVVAHVPSGGG